ncbi:rCG55146 [Rattus norvegicus]|uniref:RCG55146 n=1 Tax=Rattus norvegicus TaxID=10116 RepID=A6IIK4_RAT|nr:rCG55146 [Rattus norvegicus]
MFLFYSRSHHHVVLGDSSLGKNSIKSGIELQAVAKLNYNRCKRKANS